MWLLNVVSHCAALAAGAFEVVIDRQAGEAVLKGADVFAPGLLACSAGVQEGDLVAVSIALEAPGRYEMHMSDENLATL